MGRGPRALRLWRRRVNARPRKVGALGRGGDHMDVETGAGGGGVPFREAAEDTLRVIEGSAVDGVATGKMAANRRKLPAWLSREEMVRTRARGGRRDDTAGGGRPGRLRGRAGEGHGG